MEIPTTLATSIAKLINPSVIIQFTGDGISQHLLQRGGVTDANELQYSWSLSEIRG